MSIKVILYMSTTPNGYIARTDDSTPWSQEEWLSYQEMVNKVGNLVIGKKTYELAQKDGSLKELGRSLVVVLSRHKFELLDKNIVLAHSPQEAIKIIEEKGYKEALIGGGAKLDSSFLKAKLVDEIYLDIEPILMGTGILLLDPIEFECRLKLLGVKNITNNLIQLHYSIEK